MPPLRRPDAGPPARRPGPEPTAPGRPLPPADGTPAGRRAAGPAPDPARAPGSPATSGPARFDGAPAGAVPPVTDGLRPDPAIDRDPRTARRHPGPVDPGAPEPAGRRAPERSRPAAGGRRRAAEPDGPAVPRSGNAPSVPEAVGGHSGAMPTVGPADGTGRRRVVPDEPERRTPAGGEPRADRPERPADWLRQAGRLPHTDPGLPVVNRRGGTPPAAGRRPAPAAGTGELADHASGRLAVPDPAAERTAGRRPRGRRLTRARRHRPVVVSSSPTRRDPRENRPCNIRRHPVSGPPVAGALRRPDGPHRSARPCGGRVRPGRNAHPGPDRSTTPTGRAWPGRPGRTGSTRPGE
ncbi:hypothetical protein [Micromonospora sp. LH3U1]|uniref:hypothetical protein n=1 Tax=Micromonospora sp. LH3U1 TaxID=3018339 RepID=UPI00234A420B|nr:hypothetical protein [Micromonospora sp. LH3U1]WCN83704.1 hypothetical protein PCA76_11920 [Micromonospora sp. LH3U1]